MTSHNSIFEKMGLNETPNLSMQEITEHLFDNDFLSDVQFKFETNVIYAHTWELTKRSVVFQEKFNKAKPGENEVIPISDAQYTVFYEFVRFIYMDDCDVNEYNRIPLLKLAMAYKIIRLETKLINGLNDCLDVFVFCVLEKYDLLYNMMREWVENELHTVESSKKLQNLHPDVLEQILKLDYIQNFEEIKLFELLVRWINQVSEQEHIPMDQRRDRFDKFIRLIRFPLMTIQQFTDCVNKYIDLFSKSDIVTIFRQIAMGAQCDENLWTCKPRLTSMDPHRVIAVTNHWETNFSVTRNLIMRGVRFGFCNFRSNFRIMIHGKDLKLNTAEVLAFDFDKSLCNDSEIVVNLGESIELKPNYEYTVEIDTINGLKVPILRDDRRPKIQDVSLNLAQPQAVRKLKESANLLEIIFKVREERKSIGK